jgi:hypothetical protein
MDRRHREGQLRRTDTPALASGAQAAGTLDLVLAALRRRERGDAETWEAAIVFALIFAAGGLIAALGSLEHRVILATGVPPVAAVVIAWLRSSRTARHLRQAILRLDADACYRAHVFLDRPDERPAAVAALHLGGAVSVDPFETSRFRLEAHDASIHVRPARQLSRAMTIMTVAYSLFVGVVVVVGAVAAHARP